MFHNNNIKANYCYPGLNSHYHNLQNDRQHHFVIPGLTRNPVFVYAVMLLDAGSGPA